MTKGTLALVAAPLLLLGCAQTKSSENDTADVEEPSTTMVRDIHSFARPEQVRVTHVSLDLTADFDASTLSGTATLDVERSDASAPLILDTDTGLTIESVVGADGSPRAFSLGIRDPNRGTPLSIELAPGDEKITLSYRADTSSTAVQWLEPSQTDGNQPFLYTQGQAILTRSWIPLQDSPGVRVSYDARIRCPEQLVAVMSANEREVLAPGDTRFGMTHPIPPYLIALAIGDLARRELSDRVAIWAEPGVVQAAATEFEDVPSMLSTCERLFGPYRWGRYDVLVLPPAFPFGGMENPCLTFATPTILAGDKSLVSLIAHELAHSWSGNLVTNATWRDFWLNEGFTVYCEQRIVEALFGTERSAMETLNGLMDLEEEMHDLDERDEILHVDLEGRDPDDGMTAVPYDKGAAFLRRLESIVGRESFDKFLATWFGDHAFQSVPTATFRAYLNERLPEAASQVDLDLWIEGPGLPADAPRPTSPAFDAVDTARTTWLDGGAVQDLPTDSWVTMEWLRFLRGIPDGTTTSKLDELDSALGLTGARNAEIFAAWMTRRIELADGALPTSQQAALEAFLGRVGRRKFLTPLYRAWKSIDAESARAFYRSTARARYHAVSRDTLDDLLDVDSD